MEETFPQKSDHLPVYNIKAVSRLLGLLPVTLRAWERRYGLPAPRRGGQGYRLYSEYDLRTLRWLQNQIGAGMSIGRAVDYLHDLQAGGHDPAVEVLAIPGGHENSETASAFAAQFKNALTRFDESAASDVLRQAFTLFSIHVVLSQMIQPTLVELGEAWHRGEIPIAVEHFAAQYCSQHLMGMLSGAMTPHQNGVIVAACAPGELHQIGLLIVVVMLRWRGWDVKYLGPDLSLDRLEEALLPLRPRALLFSATRAASAEALLELPHLLERFPRPHPLIILGGQAFQTLALPDHFPAVCLNDDAGEMVQKIETLIHGGKRQSPDLPHRNSEANERNGTTA